MTVAGTAVRPRKRRLAVDIKASLNLLGMLGKYLGVVVVFPAAVALWYSEPVWPFLATGAITSGLGFALERLDGGSRTAGRRARGVLRRVRHAAPDRRVRVAPVPPRRR